MSGVKSIMQFFLRELHAKSYSFQRCTFLKFRKIPEITSAVKFLFYRSRRLQILCRIPALNSFIENFLEGLQVDLQRSPPQMFCGKFPKNFGGAYESSNIFYKIFYADAETSNNGRSFILMKSCYSKRYIKIHGPLLSRPPYFFI